MEVFVDVTRVYGLTFEECERESIFYKSLNIVILDAYFLSFMIQCYYFYEIKSNHVAVGTFSRVGEASHSCFLTGLQMSSYYRLSFLNQIKQSKFILKQKSFKIDCNFSQ